MFAAILPSVVVAVDCVKQGGEVGVVQEEDESEDRNGLELVASLVQTADALFLNLSLLPGSARFSWVLAL
jgi:hypothetical protein